MPRCPSFRSVQGEVFKEAIKLASDTADTWKTDLTAAVQGVGLALDDPINGMTGLSNKLYDAVLTDNPWVHGKTLIHVAGSRALRLRDLFKNKTKWHDLIISDARGRYRLNVKADENSNAARLGQPR